MPHRIESPFSFRLAEKITGVHGGTVPFRYGEARGIFSFEKRMSPRPPKEKRGGISISPRAPLKRHKGAGCGPNTVMAIRFPALMGRQSCHFLGSGPLYPPPAALWCFHLWTPPETRDGAGKTNPQGDEGRETRIKPETDRVVRSEAERTGVEMRRFGFALHFALHPQVRGYADLIFGYSAAGR